MNTCPAPAARPLLPRKLPLDRDAVLWWLDDLVLLIEQTLEGQRPTREWDAQVALRRMEEAALEAIQLLQPNDGDDDRRDADNQGAAAPARCDESAGEEAAATL
jgi:hypothetical protein